MVFPFTGNGFYCYSNSLHMVLQDAGMGNLPDPGFVECLTTMPFGSTYLNLSDGPLTFFSGPNIDPDKGISLASRFLGWNCEEWYGGTADEAMGRLQQAVRTGPALVGPVDMGYLSYNQNSKNLAGIDHYVVVLEASEAGVRLHDPAGFPYAVLPESDFVLAWQADQVVYKRGQYTFRRGFRQERSIDRTAMISLALDSARDALSSNPSGPVAYGGEEALLLLSKELHGQVHPRLAAHLVCFALPLAARRAVDAARFLLEGNRPGLAALMDREAQLFGEANRDAVHGRWRKVGDIVDRLADLEQQLAKNL